MAKLAAAGAAPRPNGLLVDSARVSEAARALTEAGLGPVTAARPDFVFEVGCPPFEALKARVC